MVYLFLAEGFEEVEALTPVDLMRRAGIEVTTVGVGGEYVTGAHGITVKADICEGCADPECEDLEMVVLPGGMPGTLNLKASEKVNAFIDAAIDRGAYVAAICAAPSILGEKGLLEGKMATCYPGFEDKLRGAMTFDVGVIAAGNIITARAAGSALDFAAELIGALKGEDAAEEILDQIHA
ncbi:MAG: DJ-1/PfpI family protein [Clostridia bacterium]|nr:DJ-1/PfpI family protein [Clostridia bacterium]